MATPKFLTVEECLKRPPQSYDYWDGTDRHLVTDYEMVVRKGGVAEWRKLSTGGLTPCKGPYDRARFVARKGARSRKLLLLP